MELITVEIEKLTPHPENYNCHPSEQLDEIADLQEHSK